MASDLSEDQMLEAMRKAHSERTLEERKQHAEEAVKAVELCRPIIKIFLAAAEKIMANPNADGWVRLCEILREARHDKRVTSSSGASGFLELVYEIAVDSLTAATEKETLKPLVKILKSVDQSEIAKRLRVKLTEGGDTFSDIIEQLARSEDETAHELWPQLYGRLDELHLNPIETENRYDYGDSKHITFGQFANRVSEFRRKIRKKSG